MAFKKELDNVRDLKLHPTYLVTTFRTRISLGRNKKLNYEAVPSIFPKF